MVILTTIYVVVAVLLLFGAAIFVHEWGHFYVARKCGMKVEEFAIGFGKILWKHEKDGILYTIRMIPAGGFVKLPQMLTSEAIEGGNGSEETEPLPDISPWAKIAVAVAGPIMNVVFAFVLATIIYFVGLPESITPPIVGALDKESEEYSLGIREGDIITKIDGEAIPSWEKAAKFTALALTNRFAVTFQRQTDSGVEEFTQTLMATPVSEKITIKRLQLPSKFRPIAGKVMENGAAEAAGLKAKDEIISLGGVPVGGPGQLISALQENGTNRT
ncbi:MAG: RIP metalloprotease RseP, partial [Verrucomicrobiota bacterium]|nr:RIP metalloprotease RseP [Verrucomicrobiota bacterium]